MGKRNREVEKKREFGEPVLEEKEERIAAAKKGGTALVE